MNDLSSAMEEVRLSSQPIDMEESSEAVTMEEDSNMSVDEKREQEYKLRVLEALEKGVQHQLKKKKDLGVDILSDLGVLGQMKECILDKNKYIDKKLSEKALSDSALSNYSRQNAPSELVHMPDMQNERDATDYYEMTPGGCDVHVIRVFMTPTDKSVNQLEFSVSHHTHMILDLNSPEDGIKLLEEVKQMIKYLVQHGDYSINYQNTIIARLEQDREIIATTKPSRERREAINFLHKHYDRYEADKKRMDARMFCGPVFNRRLFKYNQSKGLELRHLSDKK
ncbi:Protein CBG27910 [Caenorhabditis briggsae]|uniref:Protein CBG27910 n=1 Tax=Caenorhabditis briggsae TaxID=6238 RepID=B6IEK5_CAEBR|nr:Protein CBG27910 [Caenorhabditis briggsae]CAR98335.1 Protein CBG27910 [Caenorhabditis briggsae]